MRRLVRNPTIKYISINLNSKLHSFKEIFYEKIHYSKYGKKENQINTGRNKQERADVCNPTIQYIIINLHSKYDYPSLHSFTEIFDKKFIILSTERKKIGQVQERISRRGLVCNPTIQHVFINLYTKYDSSSLHGYGEIFDEEIEGTDGRKNGRTDVNQYIPTF